MFEAYLAFYETSRSAEEMGRSFVRLLADDPHDFRGLMALKGNEPVGITHYLFHRKLWDEAPSCYLQDLFVSPAACGAGRALIEAVHSRATAQGARDVYWLTQEFNHTAQKLYDSVAQKTPFIKYAMTIA